MGIRRRKPTDPFDDGRLDGLEQPVHITLIWDDSTESWELTSNYDEPVVVLVGNDAEDRWDLVSDCEDQAEVVRALLDTVERFAVGDLTYDE